MDHSPARSDVASSGLLSDVASGRSDPGRTVEFVIGLTSLGRTLVGVTEQGVCAVLLGEGEEELSMDLAKRFPGRRLREGDEPGPWATLIFACVDDGTKAPPDLPFDLKGTDFQRAVWAALLEIPSGETATYSQVAARIGRPSSVRAVARACAANPMAVLVPCHRVLRGDGGLSGYRWGLERKRQLLRREGVTLAE